MRLAVVWVESVLSALLLASCASGGTARAQLPDTARGAGQAAVRYLKALDTQDRGTLRAFACTRAQQAKAVSLLGGKDVRNTVDLVTRTGDHRWRVEVRRGGSGDFSIVDLYVDHASGHTEVCFR